MINTAFLTIMVACATTCDADIAQVTAEFNSQVAGSGDLVIYTLNNTNIRLQVI